MRDKKIDIMHIYAGTSGSAGLYLNEIYLALNHYYSQEAIVSYYFAFPYGKKWFYKWTDLSSEYYIQHLNAKVRLFIRYIELIITLLRILFYFTSHKIKIINYNLTSDLKVEYWFLFFIKRFTRTKVIITCHDVVPFYKNDNPIHINKKNMIKKSFFLIADYLIIHNKNSREDLLNVFNINAKKVLLFPFPLMDLNQLSICKNSFTLQSIKPKLRVGMVGHFRKDKGLDILLQAWCKFYSKNKSVELIVAGNIPYGIGYNFNMVNEKSFILIDKFIDDGDYKYLIEECDLIVLPYIKGTNSGIPSSVLSMGTLLITSDIPMFNNNPLIQEVFMFKKNNVDDLCSKLEWVYSLSENERQNLIERNYQILFEYKKIFYEDIIQCFSFLNNIN